MITPDTSRAAVLDEIVTVLRTVLDLDDLEIEPEMSLTDELGMESIDLVTIGAMLTERYGERVNLASYLADMEIDDVIRLTVGGLVDFVAGSLPAAHPAER